MPHRCSWLLAVLVWLPSSAALAPNVGRRAVLRHATTAAAAATAVAVSPMIALADLADLDAEEPSAPAVATRDAGFQAVTLSDATKPKKKEMSTPAQRLKELQAKGNLSDKEKKELRKLKADEMCEMLGRGC